MIYETGFLIALGATSVVEVPSVFVLSKFVFKCKEKWWRILYVGFLTSVTTLPYLWFVFRPYLNSHYYVYFMEVFITLFEAAMISILLNIKIHKGILISLISNVSSFLFGIWLFY